MDKKVYRTLEFDKILEKLSNFGVLDKTKEALLSLTPNTDINSVSKLNLDTDNAMRLIIKNGNPPIYNFYELDSMIKRLEIGGSLSQGELIRVATLLKTARLLIEYLKDDFQTFKDRSLLFSNKRFEEEIFSKIISEEEIADTASDELYKIRRQKLSAHGKIRETLQKYTNSPTYKKYLQNATATIRNDRFVLPVKQEFKGEIDGLVHSSSDSGATIFVEPMVIVNLNNSLKELESQEKEEIEKILIYLSGQAAGFAPEIASNYSIILSLDLIFAKAKYSLSIKGEVPILNDKGCINLKKAIHPLLDQKTAVPIDISIGDGFDTLVITGPNTGGKTVSLKTVGLFTLMAQCGIAIPAFTGSQIAVFKNICADIGDEQSIEQSLSTFSSHMTNIASIINSLSEDSLLLFDELGAGTDPTEGAALAIAIIEYLRKKGARVIATTHYPEIKLYALSQKGVKNASLEFSVETLMPTYRLIMGMPGKSNAFAISKKLGLLDEILDIAESHISSDALKFEDVLTVIDEQRKSAEKEKTEAENLKLKVLELEKELNSKKEFALNKNREIIEQARIDAVEIIDQAREKSEEIIKQLNEETKTQKDRAKAVGNARKLLADERKIQEAQLDKEKQKSGNPIATKDIKIGLSVMLDGFDKPVTIDSNPDSKGNLTVLAGIMKVKTNITKLSKCEIQTKKSAYNNYRNVPINNKEIRPELDLRGMDLFEAEYATEKFIDDAILSRIPALVIIHGKGTGVLRSGIHSLLKKNKAVKYFRLGTFGEGEAGVTIVELK
jgi:DNA mismatch repair protein MutS2